MSEVILFESEVCLDLSSLSRLRKRIFELAKKSGLNQEKANQLITVIHELLINLIKHPRVKPEHVILVISLTEAGGLVCKIKDNGSAFKQFDRKLRAASISTELKEGGYGLYILKQYFTHIAYSQKKRGINEYNQLSFAITNDKPLQFNKKRIAVIDDDLVLQHVIKSYLSQNYMVEVFSNGEDFLNVYDLNKYSLILCDISLPGIDGISIRSKLAEDKETDMIPFVFITSKVDKKSIYNATSLSIDDYIKKPFKKSDLFLVIERILNRKKSERITMHDVLSEKITAILKPQIQRKLGALKATSWTKSASSGGGDFLIYMKKNDEYYVILGDVMGHGISAKFYAHMYAGYIRTTILAMIKTNDYQLNQLVSEISSLIYHDEALDTVIVTALFLKIQSSGQISMINAGHPYPLLIDNSALKEFKIKGSLLGIMSSIAYQEKTLLLKKGQRLMLFTDGLYESGQDNIERENNKNAIMKTIADNLSLDIQALSCTIKKEFEEITGDTPYDDTTFVLLEHDH